MINYDKINEKAIILSSLYGISNLEVTIILLEGYTLCQDDIKTEKELNSETLI